MPTFQCIHDPEAPDHVVISLAAPGGTRLALVHEMKASEPASMKVIDSDGVVWATESYGMWFEDPDDDLHELYWIKNDTSDMSLFAQSHRFDLQQNLGQIHASAEFYNAVGDHSALEFLTECCMPVDGVPAPWVPFAKNRMTTLRKTVLGQLLPRVHAGDEVFPKKWQQPSEFTFRVVTDIEVLESEMVVQFTATRMFRQRDLKIRVHTIECVVSQDAMLTIPHDQEVQALVYSMSLQCTMCVPNIMCDLKHPRTPSGQPRRRRRELKAELRELRAENERLKAMLWRDE